jgi:hypothetical protein
MGEAKAKAEADVKVEAVADSARGMQKLGCGRGEAGLRCDSVTL